jgi:ABC-2 type transport system permease protein
MLTITGKDLRQRLRDRSAYIMGLVGPLALVVILNGTLGSVDENTGFALGVVNDDAGEIGAGFVAALDEIEAEGIAEVSDAADRAGLETLVDDGDVGAGFVVPAGFSDAIAAQQPAEVLVIGDPGAAITVQVAEAIATSFGHEIDYVSVAVASAVAAGAATDLPSLAGAAQAVEAPVRLAPVETEGRGYDAASYYAVSLSVFFAFFTVQFGVLSLMEERENGTLSRLLVAPIPTSSVLVAKLLSALVIGVGTMIVLVVATTVVVGAQWGNPIGVGALIVIGVLTAIALAMVVGAVARTAEQAGAYASIAAVVLGLLGGAFFPLNNAPGLLSLVSYASPHRWLLDGFRDLSYGAPLADVVPSTLPLIGFIVVLGGLGLALARRGLTPS